MVRTGFAGLAPRTTRRWAWWLFVVTLAVVALGSQSYHADAAGEGVFSLDKSEYSTPEGTAVTVGVNRTDGGVIQKDITVTLQLVGGTAGVDYPASTVTQIAVFKAGTSQTFASVQFQTLNQNRVVPKTPIGVRIISVDNGGGLGTPSQAIIQILGSAAPRVTNVIPRSAGQGSTITILGENFIPAVPLCPGTAKPDVRCISSVEFLLPGSVAPGVSATAVNVISTSQLTVTVPAGLSDGVTYDVRVVVADPALPSTEAPPSIPYPYRTISDAGSGDWFTFAGGAGSPTITNVSPATGSTAGGSIVTITGTAFTACSNATVYFGTNLGTNCQLLSDTSLRITTPSAPAAGTVDVWASFPGGTTPITTETKFTYTGAPTISSMSTNFGPASGGTLVTIVGTGFTDLSCDGATPTAGVTFGAANARCSVTSPTQLTAVSPPGVGTVQVKVTNNAGLQSPFTTVANFNYVSGPVITSISPASGPPQGGAVVVINGNGFAPGAQVTFGGVAASPVAFFSSTQLQVTAPAGKGTVHVVVSVGGASSPTTASDLFAYSIPVVDSIVPNAGPPAGGVVVVINGANFTVGTTVQFGAITVPSTFVTPLQIQATAPAGVIGVVDVRVTTPSGQSAVAPGRTFTYTTGPIIAAINPANGPTTGGIPVVITGTNFLAGATVTFGSTAAEQVNVNSASQITTLLPPASAPGVIDVRVTTSGGMSPISTLSKYTYSATAPVITMISPNKAPTIGGTTITITGIGFLGVECPGGVKFGTVPAASCTVDSDSSITAVTPANVPGETFLTVTSASGTSELAQNFTFAATGSGGEGGDGGDGTGGSVPGSDIGPATGQPVTYQLDFRWTLLVWRGANGADIGTALRGTGQNDLTGMVGAIYGWDPVNGAWLGYFPGATAPGANNMQTFVRGGIYWFSLSSPGAVFFTISDD